MKCLVSVLTALVFLGMSPAFAVPVGTPLPRPPVTGALPPVTSATPYPGVFNIQPWSVTNSCLAYEKLTAVDHRTNPPQTVTYYNAAMVPCGTTNPVPDLLLISDAFEGSTPWSGTNGDVVIGINGVGCLANPIDPSSTSVPSSMEARWEPCMGASSTSTATPDAYRQAWHIDKLPNGAISISSKAAAYFGIPGAQPQCLERIDPTNVRLVPCSGLHNWMASPVSP